MSDCKFHDWTVVGDDETQIAEKCKLCNKFESYRKVDGGIDNKRYLKNHVRDFIQPEYKSAYIQIHGQKAYDRSIQTRVAKEAETNAMDEGIKEGMDNVRESLKHWKHLESKGFTQKEIIKAIQSI